MHGLRVFSVYTLQRFLLGPTLMTVPSYHTPSQFTCTVDPMCTTCPSADSKYHGSCRWQRTCDNAQSVCVTHLFPLQLVLSALLFYISSILSDALSDAVQSILQPHPLISRLAGTNRQYTFISCLLHCLETRGNIHLYVYGSLYIEAEPTRLR